LQARQEYRFLCNRLSEIVERLIESHFHTLASIGSSDFERAVFLAGAARIGAAQEASLKMLEMTAGRVSTISETYLGLRHGPMSYVDDDSLVVCFLSSEEPARAYEIDLLRELDRKSLGRMKVVIGEGIPANVLRPGDAAIECRGLAEVGDENACVVDVVVGQLLGFFRCLREGLRPDSPSAHGVINRVVEPFRLHGLAGSAL